MAGGASEWVEMEHNWVKLVYMNVCGSVTKTEQLFCSAFVSLFKTAQMPLLYLFVWAVGWNLLSY